MISVMLRHSQVLHNCFNARSGGVTQDKGRVDDDGSDSVELEKSNVLLMGPTGSGIVIYFWIIHLSFVVQKEYLSLTL